MAPSETGVVNPCDDSSGGVGYNIVLSPFRGAMVTTPIYDTNGDGIVNASDIAVAAVSTEWDGRDVILTAPPCTTPGGCRPDGSGLPGDPNAQQPVCGPGTILPLALARGGRTVSCVETPAPERWWWRQLTQ
jgi:type IV pilus assembly protein PilY1